MDNWQFFLKRCLHSIELQSYKDYEVVLVKHSTMPVTSNRAIESAGGELIKVLYMDDYLAHENSLQEIVDNFGDNDYWLVTGCVHDRGDSYPHNPHMPKWSENMGKGENTIGSPSVLTMRADGVLLFDPNLSWLLDCDLYERLYQEYGSPKVLNTENVVIGIGEHQMTHILTPPEKEQEHVYLTKKYG